MARLFKDRIIKESLEKFEISDLEKKLDIIKSWQQAHKNGALQEKTETQCEQSFNQDLFIKVLGYGAFPEEPYTIQPKDSVESGGGDIPDATLGYFSKESRRVIAVVEIKDANTDLDKSQPRSGSPVQQAFKYKPQFKECGFVIATNFFEIRLFRDNQLDYERFTLDELVNPENNYYQFRKFYFLLCAKNFIRDRGQTETEKLLSAIRVDQEKITNKFYKLYKQLREDLIRDILQNNPQIRRESFYNLIVEKSQKILDRIVFICFFEDSGLLPTNKLNEVIDYSQKGLLEEPVWEPLKRFFKAIDEGSARLGIDNGYNGELFKNDDDLNGLRLSNEICLRFIELTKYDFEEDLSVNILGHIFEQSITDLERLKNYSEAKQEPNRRESKRKKDGIFYTPEHIVDYIVKNSLGRYLEQKEERILKAHKVENRNIKREKTYNDKIHAAYKQYQQELRAIKVLDPACGSGAFLVKVFDYLLEENKRVANILAETQNKKNRSIFDSDDAIKQVLEDNIYGVDLNPESVEITKLSLWLKSAKKGKKLITLKDNIKCGNSIVDDAAYDAQRAFVWEQGFQKIIERGGFDVIVGNPPYVRQEHVKSLANYLENKFKSYSGKADLYVYFFEKAVSLLKTGGVFGFISSGKFFEASYGKPLLDYLTSNTKIVEVLNFRDFQVFSGVSAYPVIFIAEKENPSRYHFHYQTIENADNNPEQLLYGEKKELSVKNFRENQYKFFEDRITKILAKLETNSKSLEELGLLPLVGVKTGFNEGFLTQLPISTHVKPYIFGRDLKKYILPEPREKIIFPYDLVDGKYALIDLKDDHTIIEPLEKKQSELANRAIIKDGLRNGSKHWYEYQQIKKDLNFDNEYIVYPNVSLGNNFTLSKGAVADMTAFIIPSNDRMLLGILNSSLIAFLMKLFAITRRGGYLEYKIQYMKRLPIKFFDGENKVKFIKKVKDIIEYNTELAHESLKQERLFKSYLGELKEGDDIIASLEQSGLSMKKRSEILAYHDESKKKIESISSQIRMLDEKIDKDIFDLYGLNADERNYIIKSL